MISCASHGTLDALRKLMPIVSRCPCMTPAASKTSRAETDPSCAALEALATKSSEKSTAKTTPVATGSRGPLVMGWRPHSLILKGSVKLRKMNWQTAWRPALRLTDLDCPLKSSREHCPMTFGLKPNQKKEKEEIDGGKEKRKEREGLVKN